MADSQHSPFAMLVDIDRRCRELAANLPAQQESVRTWSGIGFRLGGLLLVAPMGEVGEILHEPGLTALPGVKPWVKGVANVRGRLLPVLDLCGYFGIDSNNPLKQRRVLVVERGEVFVGLIVDEVFGMQHFPITDYSEHVQSIAPEFRPFVHGQFQRKDSWLLFSPHSLATNQSFLAVAV
ncbi:chemotaxis protein CheW [Pseudomonas matsuisoli]|uniref:Protein PilI n=1 Tax=Pseudomonas matsuisoli TaxID=1515666 RepID=A0A917UZY8_9PSED|nr:chemotaxis protein CheW [Pseudomonas matsuisoli]GGK02901.1 protein PilI [Pseudomonas matsuisoli]